MKCNYCSGKGSIMRRPYKIHQTVTRQAIWDDGVLRNITEDVVTEAGGIDACPYCATKAENEYRMSSGGMRP